MRQMIMEEEAKKKKNYRCTEGITRLENQISVGIDLCDLERNRLIDNGGDGRREVRIAVCLRNVAGCNDTNLVGQVQVKPVQ